MTNSEPPRPRRPILTLDEIIACVVALGTMGTILYFGTRSTEQAWFKKQDIFGVASTLKQSEINSPTINPSINPSIAQGSSNLESNSIGVKDNSQNNSQNSNQSNLSASSLIKPYPSEPSCPNFSQSPATTPPANSPTNPPTNPSTNPPKVEGLSVPKTATSAVAALTPPSTAAPITPKASSPSPTPTGETTPVVRFPDVPDGYWAKSFIEVVAGQKLMTALGDGKFSPDQAMTRADFAQALQQVLSLPSGTTTGNYPDVGADSPNLKAIQAVTKAGFMRGYPDGQFKPSQPVTRQDVLVTLISGLNLLPPQDAAQAAQILQAFQDVNQIPAWANGKIAAATVNNLVVNYPEVKILQPQKTATRAEVAAFLYQALAKQGKAQPIKSPYLVKK